MAIRSLQGCLLIATPALLDPNFFQSVVLIVEHNDDGATGVVLNRPTEMTVSEAWQQVSAVPYQNAAPVFQGGPCPGPLIVLHNHESASQIQVMTGVHYSTDAAKIAWLVSQKAEPMKFFVGYAGWDAAQLESELAESAWVVVPASAAQIFGDPENLWASLAKAFLRNRTVPNVDPRMIPPDPSCN